MMKPLKLLFALLPIVIVSSCIKGKGDFLDRNHHEEGISIIRYDRLQYEVGAFDSYSALQMMNTTYAPITRILVEDVLAIGWVEDQDVNRNIQFYYSDTTLIRLMKDVEKEFSDISDIEKALTKGFRKLQKEIPGIVEPMVYAQISALNESIVVVDTLLGISLDKYLGTDYPMYARYYHEYQSRSMKPERIVPDCFIYYLLAEYMYPYPTRGALLDVMLHQGRIYYAVQQILNYPSIEDLIGFSEDEKKWCRKNRKMIWEYMESNKQLYSTDPMVIRRYILPMPYTPYFGENSPACIGTWLGTEIVAAYMRNHKDVTLGELLDMRDHRKILEESGYKP